MVKNNIKENNYQAFCTVVMSGRDISYNDPKSSIKPKYEDI